jgi:hypothetical protein
MTVCVGDALKIGSQFVQLLKQGWPIVMCGGCFLD